MSTSARSPKHFINVMMDGDSRRLCRVNRYSSSPLLRNENVAEHTFYVSWMCLNLYHELFSLGVELNLGDLLAKALVHDYDEALTGDIPRPFKYFSEEVHHNINKAAKSILKTSSEREGLDPGIIRYVLASKDGAEGLLVAFSDLLCAVSYMSEEVQMGNQLLRKKVVEASTYLKGLRTKWSTSLADDTNELPLEDDVIRALLPYVDEAIEYSLEKIGN